MTAALDAAPIPDAVAWLADWQAIGGGVTIARSGSVSPWRIMGEGRTLDEQLRCAISAEAQLIKLVERPELLAPIRAIMGATASGMIARALKDMKK